MKTRGSKVPRDDARNRETEDKHVMYMSSSNFNKFKSLSESLGLDSDQLLSKLIERFLQTESPLSNKQKTTEADIKTKSSGCKRQHRKSPLRITRRTGQRRSRKKVNLDQLGRNSQLLPVDASSDIEESTQAGESKTSSGTHGLHLDANDDLHANNPHVTDCKDKSGKSEEMINFSSDASSQQNKTIPSTNKNKKRQLKGSHSKHEKGPESQEDPQSQIALVLLSMSQAPRKTDSVDNSATAEASEEDGDAAAEAVSNTDEEKASVQSSTTNSKTFSCDSCPYQTNKRCDMKIHNRIHTGAHPYPCKQCGASFRQRHHLCYHELMHSNSLNFKCSHCSKSFRTMSKLKLHMKTHLRLTQSSSKAKIFNCSECDYSTSTASDLRKHSNAHSVEKNFKCEFCDFTTSWKKNLRIHRMRHTGEKPYRCRDCDFSTYDSHALRRHVVKLHSKEQAYVCKVCDTGFAQKRLLDQHQVVHTGEKPYKCPICEYSAGYRSNLRSHLLMHNPNKGFVCDQCGKAFRLKQHLTSHQKNKHADPNKVYLCQVCGYSTKSSQGLNSHMRIHSAKRKDKEPTLSTTVSDLKDPDQEEYIDNDESKDSETPGVEMESTKIVMDNEECPESLPEEDFKREHNYSSDPQHLSFTDPAPNDITPPGIGPYVLDTNPCQPVSASSDSLTLAVGSQLLEVIARQGGIGQLTDHLSLQEDISDEPRLDSELCSDQQQCPQELANAVSDSMTFDQQDTALFQYEGMAAVLGNIKPDLNYQP